MPFYSAPAGNVFYRHWPASHAIASTVVLHGYGEHSGHYRRLAAHLSRAGAHVWAPDHLGHGLTGPRRDGLFPSIGTLVANADAVMELATDAAPELPMIVIGHSLGGVAAILLAAQRPDRMHGLVLTGTPVAGSPPTDTLPPDPIMSREPSYLDELAHDPYGFDTAAAQPQLWQCLDAALPELQAAPPRLTMPVLAMYGDRDVFTRVEQAQAWAATLRNYTFVHIPGGYHDIVNDVPHELVTDHITQFITLIARPPERCV